MKHNIIPASLAIKSMRDNGYKTAAHALAELIDNSVQANARNIKLICIDKLPEDAQRSHLHLDRIGIMDDGIGMSPKLLQESLQFGGSSHRDDPNGIGKFGMGLPNASISQCRRIDVWSWKGDKTYKTYLDVDQIENGSLDTVPQPVEEPIPKEWLEASESIQSESGTLIVWSKLDRINWKTSKSIYTHSERLVGRMYRHFIQSAKCTIQFKSFSKKIALQKVMDMTFRANDPLYLSTDTSLRELPEPHEKKCFFRQFGETQKIPVVLANGDQSVVRIRYSHVDPDCHHAIRELFEKNEVGSTDWGKHCASNTGVSIVRSGRELELNTILTNGKPQERWWGVEISFEPALDEFFGVTNNKQAAVNFEDIDLKKEAELNGYDEDTADFKKVFQNEDPDRWHMHEIVEQIKENIRHLRKKTPTDKRLIQSQPSGSKTYAESVSDKVVKSRLEQGYKTKSEVEAETKPKLDQINELVQTFEAMSSVATKEAEKQAEQVIEKDEKVKFFEKRLDTRAFFDVTSKAGVTIITINVDHEFYKFYEGLPEGNREMLKLLLSSWARTECESMERQRRDMSDIRSRWGGMLSEFFYDV